MVKIKLVIIAFLMILVIYGCSKKNHPAKTNDNTTAAPAPKLKTAVPKVIIVNDNAAHKTPDGRYYYDLDGRRYWRNNKDGKYYLFNKSMYNDDAFKPVKSN